ncbi:MAG: glucosamine-6-phosphate deaminase [Candidatus Omnitrophota bacterium]|nr:MAG: glucosamine-6-phosphate deaminase [Candidatus Omnitrophota bacterium]
MKVIVCQDKQEVAREGANIFAQAVRENPAIVMGLATGGTPVGMYKKLIQMHKEEALDFSRASSFNLDEYLGLSGDHDQSYRYFMDENLFNHINIDKSKTRVPDGKAQDTQMSCRKYEEDIRAAGGIDMQLLGIGSNGHIAFNEPGSGGDSRTRVVDLTEGTVRDNARFFEDGSQVPRKAVTMGIGTILEAKKIVLLATGSNKADAVTKAIKGSVSSAVPASFLQHHPDCTFIIDREAATGL